jgi:hypothetical protein
VSWWLTTDNVLIMTVPAALDKMGQVIAPTPKIKVLGKLTKPFTADSSLDLAASQLKQLFFVQKFAVGFR